jgi:tRNA modification GTPase
MASADASAITHMAGCRMLVATSSQPGAIAILQLDGNVTAVLEAVTGIAGWSTGVARLTTLADIDRGLAVRLTDSVAQLMPHGGPRVVQRLVAWLVDRGVELAAADDIAPEQLFPEAEDRFEAMALAAVARAASPIAVDLLLDQPRRWRGAEADGKPDLDLARRLNRLIDPPLVVVAGPANVGKSTLSNTLVGRSMSIAADIAGTTRDYTSGRIDLAGVVVDWHDTPGLRESSDPIELESVEIARALIERADMVIALTDHQQPWPVLPRQPDLRVANKCDLGDRDDPDLSISAATGAGIAEFVLAVRNRLVPPGDITNPAAWLFDRLL